MFRIPNEIEHNKIMQTAKSVMFGNILFFGIMIVIFFVPFIFLRAKTKATPKIEVTPITETNNPDGFNLTEERIIQELYGDPETYADSKVWAKKSEFVDKERSAASGGIVYDEAAMEQYRESEIKAFYDNIDYNRVKKELEDRKEAYLLAEETRKIEEKEAKRMIPSAERPIILLAMALSGAFIVVNIITLRMVQNRNYMITDGIVADKTGSWRRDLFIKRTAYIQYQGGSRKIKLTYEQASRMEIGCPVYLARVGEKGPFFVCEI